MEERENKDGAAGPVRSFLGDLERREESAYTNTTTEPSDQDRDRIGMRQLCSRKQSQGDWLPPPTLPELTVSPSGNCKSKCRLQSTESALWRTEPEWQMHTAAGLSDRWRYRGEAAEA